MYVDSKYKFDDAVQHLTTESSDGYIDLQSARDLGSGETLYICCSY